MIKKMKDGVKIRNLPLSAKEFPDENWAFVIEDVASEIETKGYSDEVLFYEGARQLFDGNYRNERVFQFLVSITDGYFPNFPFLLLPEPKQIDFVEAVTSTKNPIHIGRRFFSKPLAVVGHLRYALLPELENYIEQIAFDAAREMSGKHEGTKTEDFLPPWTFAEAEVERKLNQLMARDDEEIDRSLCSFSVNIDFYYSDQEILRNFENLIKKERGKWNQRVRHENRGRKKTKNQLLRDLAIFRLFEEKNRDLNGMINFFEKKLSSSLFVTKRGWNGAISSAESQLEHLRFCLGEERELNLENS